MDDQSPPLHRTLNAGFLAAFTPVTVVGALLWATFGRGPPAGVFIATYLFGLPIALMHVFFLALPAYMMLSSRWSLNWWRSLIGGSCVGALPLGLLVLSASESWADSLGGLAILGGLGASGGITFWLALRR